MDTAEQEYDHLYRAFMQTERHTIHRDPEKVFDALDMDGFEIGQHFLEVVQGDPRDMRERLDNLLDELTQMYVMHCVKEEIGVV